MGNKVIYLCWGIVWELTFQLWIRRSWENLLLGYFQTLPYGSAEFSGIEDKISNVLAKDDLIALITQEIPRVLWIALKDQLEAVDEYQMCIRNTFWSPEWPNMCIFLINNDNAEHMQPMFHKNYLCGKQIGGMSTAKSWCK